MEDLQTRLLYSISDRIDRHEESTKELHAKLDSINTNLSGNIHDLKVSQAKCESRWSVLSKVFTFGLSSVSLSGIIGWFSSNHQK